MEPQFSFWVFTHRMCCSTRNKWKLFHLRRIMHHTVCVNGALPLFQGSHGEGKLGITSNRCHGENHYHNHEHSEMKTTDSISMKHWLPHQFQSSGSLLVVQPVSKAWTAPQASAAPADFMQKGGGRGLRPRQPQQESNMAGGCSGLWPSWPPSRFFMRSSIVASVCSQKSKKK